MGVMVWTFFFTQALRLYEKYKQLVAAGEFHDKVCYLQFVCGRMSYTFDFWVEVFDFPSIASMLVLTSSLGSRRRFLLKVLHAVHLEVEVIPAQLRDLCIDFCKRDCSFWKSIAMVGSITGRLSRMSVKLNVLKSIPFSHNSYFWKILTSVLFSNLAFCYCFAWMFKPTKSNASTSYGMDGLISKLNVIWANSFAQGCVQGWMYLHPEDRLFNPTIKAVTNWGCQ